MEIEQPQHQYYQSHERIIIQQRQQISKLKSQNKTLSDQVKKLNQHCNLLRVQAIGDPLYNLFQQFEPSIFAPSQNTRPLAHFQDLQKRLGIYHEQLESSQKHRRILQNRIQQKQNLLAKSKRKQLQQQQLIQTLKKDLDQLTSLYEVHQNTITQLNIMVNDYQKKLQNRNQEILAHNHAILEKEEKTNRQIQKLSINLREVSSQWLKSVLFLNRESLRGGQKMDQNSMINGNQGVLNKDIVQKFKKQDQIMEQMGKQLDNRNQQIQKLLIQLNVRRNGRMNSQDETSNQKLSEQHDIKSFLHNNKMKGQKLTQIIKKYKQILEAYQKSNNQKVLLEKQYQKIAQQIHTVRGLKEEYQAIKNDYQNYKNLYEKLRREIQQYDQNTESLLIQNQAFHRFMYEHHGPKLYLDKISQEVKKYEMRLKERKSSEKWANISQLINMNRKLKDKIIKSR